MRYGLLHIPPIVGSHRQKKARGWVSSSPLFSRGELEAGAMRAVDVDGGACW
jgi:hypothetical protein